MKPQGTADMRTKIIAKVVLATSLSASLIAGAILARPAAAQDDLPDGPGKAILTASCNTGCHSMSQVTGEHQTAEQWNSTVTSMITFGANVPDAQFDTLVAYLATNFGIEGQPAPAATMPASNNTAPAPTPVAQ
jgi:competence protein ComEA